MKLLLIEMLDKNLLYVNYSERNDRNSGVSEEDKSVNEGFYS
jgi:adenine-specific DNA-methyltransferase